MLQAWLSVCKWERDFCQLHVQKCETKDPVGNRVQRNVESSVISPCTNTGEQSGIVSGYLG